MTGSRGGRGLVDGSTEGLDDDGRLEARRATVSTTGISVGSTRTGGSGGATQAGLIAKGTTSTRRARRPTVGASEKGDGGAVGSAAGPARRRPDTGATTWVGAAATGLAATRRPTYGWSATCSAE